MLHIKEALNFDDFFQVLLHDEKIELDNSLLKRVLESFEFLKEFSENKVIYGVNTGFGPMAQYKIKEKDRVKLQFNLIRSHASGMGKPMEPMYVKALMLARLNTLALGKSGVHPSVIETMTSLINKNITPVIYEHGGVGASGDLVQLAHLALVLIGEGEVFFEGERRKTKEVFKSENIDPIKIELREGLGLMNGTSAMTGIGIVNVIYAKRLLDWSIFCSSAINEIVQAYDDHLSEELNNAKLHVGQQKIARKMRSHLSDSQLTRDRNEHLYSGNHSEKEYFKEKVQEYYSLRCVPQVLGPVYDTIENVKKILLEEVNSANDNPIIDVKSKQVYHGGNFHGDYVSLEMDKLKLVVTKLSILAERQLNYLLNNKLNNILPPFVNLGVLGLNFGMQGAQFSAVSTTAENQMLSNSMYVHSIPNNNDNQDVVSMGTNAANITKTVIENSFQVISVELVTIMQALKYLDFNDKLSSKTLEKVKVFENIIPEIREDLSLSETLEQVKVYLQNNDAY
ncbi:histidine ammonia-lyase [Gillisia sp. Hel_I_29]|uniref:HAL/PAL/TAL family ammonia-lyase n=1 Tax=Gillisia sp. Hel_I_29 TaxID=1249975 RepID=UPI0005589DFC|nr:aromatic amino acid ammonia-lyase [Gillisia sp. Hel_I_29]